MDFWFFNTNESFVLLLDSDIRILIGIKRRSKFCDLPIGCEPRARGNMASPYDKCFVVCLSIMQFIYVVCIVGKRIECKLNM